MFSIICETCSFHQSITEDTFLCFSNSGSEIAGEVVETGEGVTAVSRVSCILYHFWAEGSFDFPQDTALY